jgi:hypothetical protein
MQHSIKDISEHHSELSKIREDEIPFTSEGFFSFAKNNAEKYNLIPNGDNDFKVSSWHVDDLIKDYKKTLIS